MENLGKEKTKETKRKKMETIEELVNKAIIENDISDILERFDPGNNIKKVAIQIGNEFEKQEKEEERKNRKATAIAALLVTLEKYLPWYKETLSNGINIKAIIKRKEIMRGFDIIKKK